MIKLGIFLLPDTKLKKLINNNKIQIIRIFGNQKYVSHLPHCTICVLDVSEKIMKVKKLKRAINIKPKKKLLVKKPDVFYNDPITGGDTIFYKINKIKCLSRLQIFLLKAFHPFLIKRKKKFKNLLMRRNFKTYGYPFVNKNWKPHFSIASIGKSKFKKKFILDFLKNRKRLPIQKLEKVYFFKINEDKHTLLWSNKII